MKRLALVLGATGGIGGAVARTLVQHGWQVRAMARAPATAPAIDGVEWVAGDAMAAADVVAAARGVAVIVHAVNPPGYRDWDKLVLPMMQNSIAAAKAVGARIVLPGTLYNYGSGTSGPLTETTPQQASTRKGAIRVQMEAMLKASGVPALVVRAGDFFSPQPGNNWFSQGLIKPGQPVKVVTYPGEPGVGHSWAYLPDLGETIARLLDHEAQLGQFETFHFRGHWDADGSAMVAAIDRVAGGVKVKRLQWGLLRLVTPFVTVLREMMEMRYLWRESFALDNAKLVALIGKEPHTPLDAAVRDTLSGLRCL